MYRSRAPQASKPSTQERRGTYNGATQITFHPSRLGILLERLCLEQHWAFSETERGLRTKGPTKTYTAGPYHYFQDEFTYEAAVPQGTLEKALEDPVCERIRIKPQSGAYIVTITRNPAISRWRENSRVLVTKTNAEGRELEKRRFNVQDLSSIERYVRHLL